MTRHLFHLFVTVSIGLFAVLDAQAREIRTDRGAIKGETTEQGMHIFRGIPFAAAPVGDLRWKPPQDVAAWEDVRDATSFGGVCPQGDTLSRMMGETMPPVTEDCLYLNIWSKAQAEEKLPVMVWIHGGGLTLGWGHQRGYDGTAFANSGVILVSINYRLGPLGFLAHPALSAESANGVSGNYGLLDQQAALAWIQRNIAAFGGDPDNVTIFGESAGATSVNALLASPLSKGLFHKAISQSAWVTETNFAVQKQALPTVASAEDLGRAWADGVAGEGADLQKLRSLPIDAMMASMAMYPVAVTVDGWFMPDLSDNVFARGEQQDVPLIAGSNTDEGTIFLAILPFATTEAFTTGLRTLYGDQIDQLLALYPMDDLRAAKNQFITDAWFARGTRNMLNGMQKVESPAFHYHFTRSSPMAALGAHHGLEIGYAFGNLNPTQQTETDKALSAAMHQYWLQFAKTGNPNAQRLPAWPVWTPADDQQINLGDEISVGRAYRKQAVDVLNSVLAARMSAGGGGSR